MFMGCLQKESFHFRPAVLTGDDSAHRRHWAIPGASVVVTLGALLASRGSGLGRLLILPPPTHPVPRTALQR